MSLDAKLRFSAKQFTPNFLQYPQHKVPAIGANHTRWLGSYTVPSYGIQGPRNYP